MNQELENVCSSIDQILASPLLALLHVNLEDAEEKHDLLSTYHLMHLIPYTNISIRSQPYIDPWSDTHVQATANIELLTMPIEPHNLTLLTLGQAISAKPVPVEDPDDHSVRYAQTKPTVFEPSTIAVDQSSNTHASDRPAHTERQYTIDKDPSIQHQPLVIRNAAHDGPRKSGARPDVEIALLHSMWTPRGAKGVGKLTPSSKLGDTFEAKMANTLLTGPLAKKDPRKL
jgi:hypothetical protein